MKSFRIAVIPGDASARKSARGLRVGGGGRKFGIQWKFDEFDWAATTTEARPMMPKTRSTG